MNDPDSIPPREEHREGREGGVLLIYVLFVILAGEYLFRHC